MTSCWPARILRRPPRPFARIVNYVFTVLLTFVPIAVVTTLVTSTPVYADPACVKLTDTCVEGPATRNISGVDVHRDCWRYTATYQCRSTSATSDCQALRDRGCGQIGTQCVSTADDGSCITQEDTFSCQLTPDTTVSKTVCDSGAFCQNGTGCFDTSAPQDQDFGKTVAMLEAAREAGVYGVKPNTVELFKGTMQECSVKVVGGATLSNCCSSSGGGEKFTNYAMLGLSAGKAIAAGSKYMYDALYQNVDSSLMEKGVGAATSSFSSLFGGTGSFSPTFGLYGFQFSFSFTSGFTFVGFDPASFATAVAIQLIQMWLACSTSEQTMSLQRGQDLCVQVGTYCSKKVLGVCLERKQQHCCFNSILAKIINRQGRTQFGMPMNQCGGFTSDQISHLDFSKMDFSEFIASVSPKDPDQPGMTANVQSTVTDKVKSYYGTGQ